MTKSLNASKSSTSLIAPKHKLNSQTIATVVNPHLKLKPNHISSSSTSSTGTTSHPIVSNSQPNLAAQVTTVSGTGLFSPNHSYAGKSVIITSETPLGNEDLSKIVASITANPDFKKVPVRLSNGMAVAIPGPIIPESDLSDDC
ncbi:unnamed protein product [Oppiella nova]|uniref:Uncharacterized protein n=1 Tax=Oppiella nova TaxID=334625 RepID=A0A7R9LMC3_9ACAR|nr:unnamed protein product [Oppiella nova]CAG2164435.1 unnamed protein product [Oppiella nova]